MSTRHQTCKQHFNTNTTHQQDGRFVATLPTKNDSKQLLFSRLSAEQRRHAMERRLERQLEDQYHHFVKKCEQLSHRDPVNSQGGKQPCNVLPHLNVQQPRASTSNWRARGESAKTSNGTHHN